MPLSPSPAMPHRPQMQLLWAGAAALVAGLVAYETYALNSHKLSLFVIGLAMGMTLYHAAVGFTGTYRKLFTTGDLTGVAAQGLMLILAMLLFAPFLAAGEAFGRPVGGSVAPIGGSMILGAFIFGIGMQLGGGCGSGTLFTVGGGNARMVITLIFFCIGGFWGSLDLGWWRNALPETGGIALGREWGYGAAVAAQIAVLGALYWGLRALGARHHTPLWGQADGRPYSLLSSLLRGPWPLVGGALALAVLNWLTLTQAGHPWTITWAFSLWAAKGAVVLGWDPATSGFWSGGFQTRALNNPLLMDTTTIMNIAILLGAFWAASMAGRMAPSLKIGWRPLAAAVIGGLMLGYGSRLAYGCNIGAFFSGVASTSVQGWVWIIAALAGNWIGVKLRPMFRLPM